MTYVFSFYNLKQLTYIDYFVLSRLMSRKLKERFFKLRG